MICFLPLSKKLAYPKDGPAGLVSLLYLCLGEVIFMRWVRETIDKIYPFKFYLQLFVMVPGGQVERARARELTSYCRWEGERLAPLLVGLSLLIGHLIPLGFELFDWQSCSTWVKVFPVCKEPPSFWPSSAFKWLQG